MPRKSKGDDGPGHAREVVEGRLYSIAYEKFDPAHLEMVTVLVNLTNDPDLLLPGDGCVTLQWWAADNVDERVLEGLVRMISSSMKGTRQRVLLVGAQDAVDTVSACVLREYMGCSASDALSIMREGHPGCLTKGALAETVVRYRPS